MPKREEQKFILYGKITKTHGLYGEVKIFPFGGCPDTFADLKEAYVEVSDQPKPRKLHVSRVKIQKNAAIVKFLGIDTPEAADELKNLHILVERKDLKEPGEDEYYYSDIIGLRVRTSGGENVGEVKELIHSGGYDILVVKSAESAREFLVPFVGKFVIKVDLEESTITVQPIEGLFD